MHGVSNLTTFTQPTHASFFIFLSIIEKKSDSPSESATTEDAAISQQHKLGTVQSARFIKTISVKACTSDSLFALSSACLHRSLIF